jgi:hypothetical protein
MEVISVLIIGLVQTCSCVRDKFWSSSMFFHKGSDLSVRYR